MTASNCTPFDDNQLQLTKVIIASSLFPALRFTVSIKTETKKSKDGRASKQKKETSDKIKMTMKHDENQTIVCLLCHIDHTNVAAS